MSASIVYQFVQQFSLLFRDNPEKTEFLAYQDNLVQEVFQAVKVLPVRRETEELREEQEIQDLMVHQEIKESLGKLETKDSLDQEDDKETVESQENREHEVVKDYLDRLELKVPKEDKENEVHL